MSQELLDRIQKMDDYQAVRFFNHFSKKLFDDVDLDRKSLKSQVPEELRKSRQVAQAFGAIERPGDATLLSTEAAVCARGILESLAHHPGFAAALAQSLDEYKDDEMFADVVLAVGIAASMIVLAATTKMKLRIVNGKLTFEIGKQVASPSLIKSLFSSLTGALGVLAKAKE